MTRLTVSAVHSLQLIPVDTLSRFAQVQGRVSMLWLEALSGCLLLAVYVDENGNRRVAGSPDCPLRLSYSSGEGAYMCTLSGEGVSIDPFLI